MTERIAKMAEEEKVPTIEHVVHLSRVEKSEVITDPFAVSYEDVRSISGTNPNFKRKVTNEIKKFHRGADGTESKQLDDGKEVTGYDAFGVVTPPHRLESLAQIYEASAPHYAAVNAKVANIVGLGFKLVESNKTKRALEALEGNEAKLKRVRSRMEESKENLYEKIDDFNEEETFTETLTKVWRDYETTGNGYLEVGRKKDGSIGYVGHVPSQTVRIRRKRDGFVQLSGNKAQFFANFGAGAIDEETGRPKRVQNPVGSDRPNEIIHIKRYSPTSAYYGIPDVVAAQQAIAGNEFSARFNLEYFENKAIPRHLITLKGANLGAQAQSDLLSFFETGLKGQHHRSLFIPLPADTGTSKVEFDIKPVDAKVQDSSFNNYRKANLNEILMVHRVPITKVSVSDAASLAIARDADKTFKEQVCAPEQKMFEKKLNRIIKEITDAFVMKLNEMTLTDADTQSKIDERMVKAGVWLPNEVRVREGMPTIKGGNKRVDLNAKAGGSNSPGTEARTQRQRDSERSAAASDSSGESRQPKGDGRASP